MPSQKLVLLKLSIRVLHNRILNSGQIFRKFFQNSKCRRLGCSILWEVTVHCRSDVAYAIVKLSQITETGFDLDSDAKLADKVVLHL